ncbi:30S ribosomal protein S4 [Candidatus Micrarchaeota archaeon]|nr:30S ribosomal protein S4 [Candidatus Micrarchaeota archaeon]
MGDPRKLTKKYSRPSKLYDKQRILEEKGLLREYGLKNMRELWRSINMLRKIRRQARLFQAVGEGAAKESLPLVNKLQKLGLVKADSTLDDILGLTVRDILDRRLQTIVFKKGFARTVKQARQLIVHGFISINGHKTARPSYMVPVSEEGLIGYVKDIDINAGVIKDENEEYEEKEKKISVEKKRENKNKEK